MKKTTSLDQLKNALEAGLIDQATFDDITAAMANRRASEGTSSLGNNAVAITGNSHAPIVTGTVK